MAGAPKILSWTAALILLIAGKTLADTAPITLDVDATEAPAGHFARAAAHSGTARQAHAVLSEMDSRRPFAGRADQQISPAWSFPPMASRSTGGATTTKCSRFIWWCRPARTRWMCRSIFCCRAAALFVRRFRNGQIARPELEPRVALSAGGRAAQAAVRRHAETAGRLEVRHGAAGGRFVGETKSASRPRRWRRWLIHPSLPGNISARLI